MRARIHAERPALERLLQRIERGDYSEHEQAFLARQLRHFSFITTTTLALREEEHLAERYRRAVDKTVSAASKDAVGALMGLVNTTLASTSRFADGTLLSACQDLTTRIRSVGPVLSTYDRDALVSIIERRAGRLLSAIAERARATYQARPEITARTDTQRAQTTIDAYSAALVRLESRVQGLIAAAQDLRTVHHREESLTTLLVGTKNKKNLTTIERTLQQYGSIVRFNHIPYFAVTTDDRTADDVLGRVASLGHDARIYRERVYNVSPIPAAPLSETIWNLNLVKAPRAWDVTRGAGASVAIIDTGIDYNHADLADRFSTIIGEDFTYSGGPLDDHGHGTHVAGTVAGIKTGVAPEATLYAVKVLDASGYGTETAVLQGMEWAIDQGVAVMNMSLDSIRPSSAERELVAVVAQRGIALACAAGNSGGTEYNYPASYEGATSVAAIDRDKRRASFSTRNDQVDLAAPGVAIWSCMPGNKYDSLSGTSMATPHVAGAYALLSSVGVTNHEQALAEGAEHLGAREEFGAGLIDCSVVQKQTTTKEQRVFARK